MSVATTAVFTIAYAGVSVVLRIPELAAIVEVMVDAVPAPAQDVT